MTTGWLAALVIAVFPYREWTAYRIDRCVAAWASLDVPLIQWPAVAGRLECDAELGVYALPLDASGERVDLALRGASAVAGILLPDISVMNPPAGVPR